MRQIMALRIGLALRFSLTALFRGRPGCACRCPAIAISVEALTSDAQWLMGLRFSSASHAELTGWAKSFL
ncbi:MAG: hypothetical protein HFE95_09980 [Acutalibacter sp.]|nr:hypothetical protein [Acutalibacter sp.]